MSITRHCTHVEESGRRGHRDDRACQDGPAVGRRIRPCSVEVVGVRASRRSCRCRVRVRRRFLPGVPVPMIVPLPPPPTILVGRRRGMALSAVAATACAPPPSRCSRRRPFPASWFEWLEAVAGSVPRPRTTAFVGGRLDVRRRRGHFLWRDCSLLHVARVALTFNCLAQTVQTPRLSEAFRAAKDAPYKDTRPSMATSARFFFLIFLLPRGRVEGTRAMGGGQVAVRPTRPTFCGSDCSGASTGQGGGGGAMKRGPRLSAHLR